MDARLNEPGPTPRKPEVSANEVRQGVTGHNVRYVLALSTGGGIILLGLLYLWFFGH
jgi:hypothetical protein